jgi:hypothetical protein
LGVISEKPWSWEKEAEGSGEMARPNSLPECVDSIWDERGSESCDSDSL